MNKLFGRTNIVLGIYILVFAFLLSVIGSALSLGATREEDVKAVRPSEILGIISIISGIGILKSNRIAWIISITAFLVFAVFNFLELHSNGCDEFLCTDASFIPGVGGWGQSLFYGIIQLLIISRLNIHQSVIKVLFIIFIILSVIGLLSIR